MKTRRSLRVFHDRLVTFGLSMGGLGLLENPGGGWGN
jgi:hypothetical protein